MTKTDIKNTGYDREMLSVIRLADLGGFFKDALRVVVRNKTGEAVEELAYEECGSNRSEYIEFAQKLHEEAELFRDMLHRLHRRRRMSLDFDEEWNGLLMSVPNTCLMTYGKLTPIRVRKARTSCC